MIDSVIPSVTNFVMEKLNKVFEFNSRNIRKTLIR